MLNLIALTSFSGIKLCSKVETYLLSTGDDDVSIGLKGIMVSMVAEYLHHRGVGS